MKFNFKNSQNNVLYLTLFIIIISTIIFSIIDAFEPSQIKNTKNTSKDNYEILLTKIVKNINNQYLSDNNSKFHIAQAIMKYIQQNSRHENDKIFFDRRFDIPLVLEKIHLASQGKIKEKPNITCGPRAYAMKIILAQFGIYSRLIQLYSTHSDNPMGHRLLEVFNDQSNNWEVWDPDHGVYYVNNVTNQQIGVTNLLFEDPNAITPIGLQHEGWVETNTSHLKKSFLGAVLFESETGMRNSIMVINSSRFDLEKKFLSGANFEEWARITYKYPRLIIL